MSARGLQVDAGEVRRAFYAGLDPAVAEFVREAAARAAALGTPLYLVGGAVRDLLLGRRVVDIDLVLEHDAVEFAEAITAGRGLLVVRSEAFRNAKVSLPVAEDRAGGTQHADFVTARREMYPSPGQLPRVWPGKIEQDLARRDFTINAIALPLDAGGEMLDPFRGRADIGAGVVRVLHDRSFRDDPTRIFRAARFEQRFGFSIERHTQNLMRTSLRKGLMDTLTPDRVRHELERTLLEEDPGAQLGRLAELGALEAIERRLAWDERAQSEFRGFVLGGGLRRDGDVKRLLALLLYRMPDEGRERAAQRLGLDKQTIRLIEDLARLEQGREAVLGGYARPSDLDRLLAPLRRPAVEVAMRAWAGTAAGEVLARQASAPAERPQITGDDLRGLGLPPGPAYKEVLGALRAAVADGEIKGREAEIEFVRQWAAERGIRL